ncbi:tail protein [Serratia marcescens]|nr:tail protein [Serratia marcescens]
MKKDDQMFHEFEEVIDKIMDGMSLSSRISSARAISMLLRKSQQRRIARQENPNGSKFEKRRRKVLHAQSGIRFIWHGETRRLKNWRSTRGKYGKMITGFDEERGAIRSFYKSDIEAFLEINMKQVRKNTTKAEPMFRRLRTARFLKARADAGGATVGFTGVAARIARTHQYGLRDRVNKSGAMASYPRREVLGITKADRMAIARSVIDSLGVK